MHVNNKGEEREKQEELFASQFSLCRSPLYVNAFLGLSVRCNTREFIFGGLVVPIVLASAFETDP